MLASQCQGADGVVSCRCSSLQLEPSRWCFFDDFVRCRGQADRVFDAVLGDESGRAAFDEVACANAGTEGEGKCGLARFDADRLGAH